MSNENVPLPVLLGDVAEEITVGHVGSMATEYVDTGIPFLRSQNVVPFGVSLEDVKYISPQFHAKLKKSALKPGDVVIVRTGKPGACCVIPNTLPVANCSDLVIVRPGRRLDARYICYYINSAAAHHVASHLVGAVQQHFNVGAARSLRLDLPSLEEQKRIAHILGTLDDKIELNRRMNATLEAMARALFQSWFVDFDPVRAKAAGQSPTGMDPATADLFPSEFEDSELGKIPKGWVVKPLSAVCKLISGGTPKRSEDTFWGGNIPWYSIQDAPSFGMPWVYFTKEHITARGLDESAANLVPTGCTIISARGTVGKLAMAGREMAFNQSCYGLLPAHGQSFRYNNLLMNEAVLTLQQRTHGSVFDTITRQTFDGILVVAPPEAVVEKLDKAVKPIFDLQLAQLKEAHTLAALRDALLPELLSGAIRVENADRMNEESSYGR
jgi:type I restriction enzyme S subunit